MDPMLPANVSGNEGESSSVSKNRQVIPWYFSREEIENNSPSRRDGIDLGKETRLRVSYCLFLNQMGLILRVPRITTATAIIFCHRFFLRRSHAKHDRMTIATACMFLAGKVEETPRRLKDVIIVSYEIVHKTQVAPARREEVFQQHRELILRVETLLLSTINFDLTVDHPYDPLMAVIKKYKVEEAQADFSSVACRFVSSCYRTTLFVQYKPHHIAAGAFFLAAEHVKLDLQPYGEGWRQDFDVTLEQLQDIRGQFFELFDKNSVRTSEGSTVTSGDIVHQPISVDMASTDKCSSSAVEGESSKSNVSQSGDHSVDERARLEGTEKDNSESEAGEKQDAILLDIIEKQIKKVELVDEE